MDWPEFDLDNGQQGPPIEHPERSSDDPKFSQSSRASRSLMSAIEEIDARRSAGIAGDDLLLACPTNPKKSPLSSEQNRFEEDSGGNSEQSRPALSPVLINGFMQRPVANSPMRFQRTDDDDDDENDCTLKAPEKSPDLPGNSRYGSRMVAIPPEETIGVCRSQRLFANRSRNTAADRPMFSSCPEPNLPDSDCGKNEEEEVEEDSHDGPRGLLRLPSVATPASTQSSGTSSTLLGTLPPSQTACEKSLAVRRCVSDFSEENYGSEKTVIIVQHAQSDSDVFQSSSGYADDSQSVVTAEEQSLDSVLDVTIHETEPTNDDDDDDAHLDPEFFAQSVLSPEVNQQDFWDVDPEATTHQISHRLSKLAEPVRKRMCIRSSDLAMWKCEQPQQPPVQEIIVISSTEKWGVHWTTAKNVTDSKVVYIVDSEPLKKTTDASSSATDGQKSSETEQEMRTFALYQPICRLNTSMGEIILAPRYYR